MTPHGAPKTVLIVDDDPDIRSIVSSIVTLAGHTPIESPDGESAVALLNETVPDLIVLDLMMPGIDGNEVCAIAKRKAGDSFVPVIMLTARDSIKDKVNSLEGGADDYLTKPFNYQELQARMNAQLRIHELHQKLQEQNNRLRAMQEKLVQNERQLAVLAIAGTAAHQLGQPLSAILINCHLLEQARRGDPHELRAVHAIRDDAKRMVTLIEQLKTADAERTENYYEETEIIELGKKETLSGSTPKKHAATSKRGRSAEVKPNTNT